MATTTRKICITRGTLSALCLVASPACVAGWCTAGLRCAAGAAPAFCGAGTYCAAGATGAVPCAPLWACPAGSTSPRGVGIRDDAPGPYVLETPDAAIPVDAPAPAFVPVGANALARGTVLRFGKDSDLCLQMVQDKDLARTTLKPCDSRPEQVFYMDGSSKIRTRKSSKFCLEMDPSSESWGGVFVHSACELLDELRGVAVTTGPPCKISHRSTAVPTLLELPFRCNRQGPMGDLGQWRAAKHR